jgi:multisubunit Na+/H+ antiporter MnhG subunit
MSKNVIIEVLLYSATALALLCVLGLLTMRDSYQRLNFPAPIAAMSMPLIIVALWLDTESFQARIKSLMILALLFGMNGVVTHATARACRIRSKGRWELGPGDEDVEKVT